MSIIDEINNRIPDELFGRLGDLIGEPEEKTREATVAAVPIVLSSLSNTVLSGDGLDGLLDALRGVETTSSDDAATEQLDVLGSILGSNLSTLISVLSRSAGVGVPAVKTLLGNLGPIIVRVIAARLNREGGPTPANLTSLFTAEKTNITRALPAGLSLADLPSIPGVPTSAPTPRDVISNQPPWLLPALILGLLGLAACFMFMTPSTEAPAPPPVATPDPVDPASDVIPPAPEADETSSSATPSADEVSKELSEVYAGATQALADVKDVASAEAAARLLQTLESRIDVLKFLWDSLPTEAKASVAKVTQEHIDTFKGLVSKVLEIPGVAARLKPILDAILTKIAGFTA